MLKINKYYSIFAAAFIVLMAISAFAVPQSSACANSDTTTLLSASSITLGQSVTDTATVTSTLVTTTDQVSYHHVGDGKSGTGNLNVEYPSYLSSNDLILLQVVVRDTTNAPTTPSGFTLLYGPDSTGTGRQWIYYKFATGSEPDFATVTIGGSSLKLARMYSFEHVVVSSNFYESGIFGSGSSNTINAQSVTSTVPKSLAVSFNFVTAHNGIDSFTGELGGNWQEATSDYDSSSGGGASIEIQKATMATTATISGGSDTMSSSASWGVRAFVLKAETPTTIVPTGTVTFCYKAPGGSWTSFSTKTLSGGSATSASFTPTSVGTWYFKAVYSGDSKYACSSSGETEEPLTIINPPQNVVPEVPLGPMLAIGAFIVGLVVFMKRDSIPSLSKRI
jgi:hypothetical protein